MGKFPSEDVVLVSFYKAQQYQRRQLEPTIDRGRWDKEPARHQIREGDDRERSQVIMLQVQAATINAQHNKSIPLLGLM